MSREPKQWNTLVYFFNNVGVGNKFSLNMLREHTGGTSSQLYYLGELKKMGFISIRNGWRTVEKVIPENVNFNDLWRSHQKTIK